MDDISLLRENLEEHLDKYRWEYIRKAKEGSLSETDVDIAIQYALCRGDIKYVQKLMDHTEAHVNNLKKLCESYIDIYLLGYMDLPFALRELLIQKLTQELLQLRDDVVKNIRKTRTSRQAAEDSKRLAVNAVWMESPSLVHQNASRTKIRVKNLSKLEVSTRYINKLKTIWLEHYTSDPDKGLSD